MEISLYDFNYTIWKRRYLLFQIKLGLGDKKSKIDNTVSIDEGEKLGGWELLRFNYWKGNSKNLKKLNPK